MRPVVVILWSAVFKLDQVNINSTRLVDMALMPIYSVMMLPGTAIDTVKSRPPVGWNLADGLKVLVLTSSPSSSVLLLCESSVSTEFHRKGETLGQDWKMVRTDSVRRQEWLSLEAGVDGEILYPRVGILPKKGRDSPWPYDLPNKTWSSDGTECNNLSTPARSLVDGWIGLNARSLMKTCNNSR